MWVQFTGAVACAVVDAVTGAVAGAVVGGVAFTVTGAVAVAFVGAVAVVADATAYGSLRCSYIDTDAAAV